MQKLGHVLSLELQDTTTVDSVDFAAARTREEERKSKFLVPRWDSGKIEWVETSCLTCGDLRWVTWYDNGYPCPDCSKFDRVASLLKYSGIPDVVRCQRFESFKARAGTAESLAAAKILTDDPTMDTGEVFMVLLYGYTGSGKTHLAHASGMAALDRGWPVKFIRCGTLLREFKAVKSSSENGQTKYDDLFRHYSEINYLILDELDWKTDADIAMLEDLVCEREANHLMVMITTNRNLGELQDALPRMTSRFRDKRFARMIWNQASDYRGTIEKTRQH